MFPQLVRVATTEKAVGATTHNHNNNDSDNANNANSQSFSIGWQ